MNINETLNLESLSSQNSIIHSLEGRIKLISILLIIVYSVFSTQLLIPLILEIFLLIAIYLAKIPFKNVFKRILLLLPFGGCIIIFQPFIHPGNIIWASPISWIQITDAGLNWSIILTARLIVCLTAITYLSSTSSMQEVVQSFRKLGMPKDLAMILSIMVRFLFIFIDELESIRISQKSRNFDIYNKALPYKWRIKQVGYTVAMMFLKAYEKGERTYFSMTSRCFSNESDMYHTKNNVEQKDYLYIIIILGMIATLQISVMFFTNQLGFLGVVLYA